MTINVRWDDEIDNTIVFEFIKPWTWEEFHQAAEASFDLRDERTANMDDPTQAFYTIGDFRQSGRLPGGNGLLHVRSVLSRSTRTKPKMVICVTDDFLAKSLINMFNQLYSTIMDMRAVPTFEEAYKTIHQHRDDHKL